MEIHIEIKIKIGVLTQAASSTRCFCADADRQRQCPSWLPMESLGLLSPMCRNTAGPPSREFEFVQGFGFRCKKIDNL